MSDPCAPDNQHSTVTKWLSHSAGPEACTQHEIAESSPLALGANWARQPLIGMHKVVLHAAIYRGGARYAQGKRRRFRNPFCCRSASGDVDMMKVMVGARVESDRARSALDG